MLQENFFDSVIDEVIKVSKKLGYSGSFSRESSMVLVNARLIDHSRQIITYSLISSISSITGVHFISVSIGSDGVLYALFSISE